MSSRSDEIAGRGWRSGLAIACLALLSIDARAASLSIASSPATTAAGSVWAYINGVDVEIQKCRELDPGNAASYDRTYGLYHREIADTVGLINLILQQEATRAGLAADAYFKEIQPAADAEVREANRMASTNPGAFMTMCHSLAESLAQHAGPFQPFREQLPDDMRVVDGWR
jgi:hypothetical protein